MLGKRDKGIGHGLGNGGCGRIDVGGITEVLLFVIFVFVGGRGDV